MGRAAMDQKKLTNEKWKQIVHKPLFYENKSNQTKFDAVVVMMLKRQRPPRHV